MCQHFELEEIEILNDYELEMSWALTSEFRHGLEEFRC